MTNIIRNSVGKDCTNSPGDVRVIQKLLNDDNKILTLKADGVCGPRTLKAIADFQSKYFCDKSGRVEINSSTLFKLAELHILNVVSGIDVMGIKTPFNQSFNLKEPTSAIFDSYWELLRDF